MAIKIEIGANSGRDTEHLLSDGSFVFAFEPSPILYPRLVEKFSNNKFALILPFAVDITNGVSDLNVSETGDMGVTSLYDFHENLQNTELNQYDDFKGWSKKQGVLTIRLDTFMNNWMIPKVEYLWIDAQGSDLNCIKSLGSRIYDVKEGRCECTLNVPLYQNANNTYEETRKYLEEVGGFKVEEIYRHQHDSEIDLHFYR